MSIIEKLSNRRRFFETFGVINYGSSWTKDVGKQCLEFEIGRHHGCVTSDAQHQIRRKRLSICHEFQQEYLHPHENLETIEGIPAFVPLCGAHVRTSRNDRLTSQLYSSCLFLLENMDIYFILFFK